MHALTAGGVVAIVGLYFVTHSRAPGSACRC